MLIKNALLMISWLCMASAMPESTADYSQDVLVKIDRLDKALLNRLLSDEGLDEWSMAADGRSAIFRVPRKDLQHLKKRLRGTPAQLSIKHQNVQQLIDEESVAMMEKSSASDDWFGVYHPLAEIGTFYTELAIANPHLIKKVDKIGTSFEGRDIFALHISSARKRKDSYQTDSEGEETMSPCRKRAPNKIWVQCLIHAREWISGSTCQYLAQQLVDGHARQDPAICALLNSTEIIMVPVVNPDGYEHTWKRDRLWRKNRHPFRFGTGVDLNRNFADEHWCKTGASNIPFADTYCGPAAGSEPETKAVQQYYKRYAGRVAAAIDFHSFSQLILRPNGFNAEPSQDEQCLLTASELMADAIESVHGKSYISKRASELYPTTGSATDYFYGLPGQAFRPYSIAVELRPSASEMQEGFLLDPSQIRPCVEEVMTGFMAFVQYALENPLRAKV